MWRMLAFAVMVHLIVDPNLPGVVNFDADQILDATSRHVRSQIRVAKPRMLPDPVDSSAATPPRIPAAIARPPVMFMVRVDVKPRGHLLWFAPASPDDHRHSRS